MDVSVIIPTYRPGSYLYDCLQSVLSQDFSYERFEIVIVLNGERNPYYDEINSFFKDKKVSYKLHYANEKGVSFARNLALDNLKSEYVVFLDDDDVLTVNFLSGLYSKVSSDTIAVSNLKTFVSEVDRLGNDYMSRSFIKCKNSPRFNLFSYRGFLSSACAKMIPSNVINGFRFDTNLSLCEDALFMFELSCNIGRIQLTDECVIYYRRLREGSASHEKLSFKIKIRNMLQNQLKYSMVFFSGFGKYNLLLYISRLVATMKYYIYYK